MIRRKTKDERKKPKAIGWLGTLPKKRRSLLVCASMCSMSLSFQDERLVSLSRTRMPRSWYSSRDIQNDSLSFMTSARTAPPMKTMSLRRGGSSMRILNFCTERTDKKKPNTITNRIKQARLAKNNTHETKKGTQSLWLSVNLQNPSNWQHSREIPQSNSITKKRYSSSFPIFLKRKRGEPINNRTEHQ